ncbi:hypothetical protein WJX74_002572 [Apatococcus lobatus]|uniref:glutamate--tRNA ligase n=1 Tax=Apatococcus lobatus TaxID=904363 RepID=A0AAW1QJ89_9CHLO
MTLSNRTVLTYSDRNTPLAAIATARLAAYPIDLVADPKHSRDAPAVLTLDGSEELEGQTAILRFLARAATVQTMCGSSPLAATRVDQWLDFSCGLTSGAGLEGACGVINYYLSLRTFLVDYCLTVADIACWGQLQGTLQWDKLMLSGNFPHLARWYNFLCELPELQDVAEQYGPKRRKLTPTAAPAEAAKDAGQKGGKATSKAASAAPGDTGSFEIDLPNASEGNVTTRFPPEPSGYLHIGHAKAAMLNQYFAQHYKGRLLLRFDDTNPSKEKDEYVEQILKDVAALGVKYDKLSYTSNFFPQLADCAERLIKLGHLYADDTPVEQMRLERGEGTESACRRRSKEDNLQIWEEMKAGSEVGKKNCLRFRMDMANPNKALRDPTAARCNPTHHWRTGQTYKVYPTYDFACPFVDSIEGVTHALRTSEYRDRQEQYYRILKMCQEAWPGLPDVHLWDFSRLTFVNTLMSKRKLDWFVRNGRVDGWTDPRFPTVQGLYRRGLQLEAMREFILSQGASKNVTLMEWDKIWTINKRIIDPVCPRHTAISDSQRVKLHLTNGPQSPEVISVPKNKKHPPAGIKATTKTQDVWLEQADAAAIKEGEEVTLMDWGNAIVKDIERSASGEVTHLMGELHLEGNFKTTKLKLTWLPVTRDLVPLELHDFDHLLTKKKLEEEDSFEDFINPCSRWTVSAVGDANMRSLQKGDILQLERKGYFRVDVPLLKPTSPIILFAIPDGRVRSQQSSSPVPACSAADTHFASVTLYPALSTH